jgi:glutaredoxin
MRKATQDYNLYLENPGLVREWHPTKNGKLGPRDVTPASGKKVWWLCKEGHEWIATIYSRNRGSGCPICKQKSRTDAEILMISETPLLRQWHPTRNIDINPRDLGTDSGKKVWWLCKEGHEWQATVKSRMKQRDCPFCVQAVKAKRTPTRRHIAGSGRKAPASAVGGAVWDDAIITDMKSETDFRKNKRFKYKDTVMLEHPASGQWSYARSFNISEKGMLLESAVPYRTGSRISIHFSNPPFRSSQKIYRAVVRWCKGLSFDDAGSAYGLGVKFI